MAATNSLVKTGVDTLIDLLKEVDRISVEAAAKKLRISNSLLQSWIDLLVEEEIVGIEYKFITPYIYLLKKRTHSHDLREEFFQKALAKGISESRVEVLWKQYLLNHMEVIRKQFYEQALRRGYTPDKIDVLWHAYHKNLLFPKNSGGDNLQ